MTTNRIFRTTPSRIILMLLAFLLLTGCAAQYQTQGKEIRATADKIAGYSVPQNYTETFAVDMLGYQVVNLQGPTENCHIYLVQAPKDTEADIDKLMEQARPKKQDEPRDVRVTETRAAVVRGQDVEMIVSEGINSEEQPYRSINLLFDGRGGPALISISSPNDQWDWDMVNTFLSSIN